MPRAVPILALTLALASCGGNASPVNGRPPATTLLAQNLELVPGGANAIRIGFTPSGSSAEIIVTTIPDTVRVTVCPLTAVDEPLPGTGCRVGIGSGVREPVARAGLRAVSIAVDDATARANVRLEYGVGGREATVVIPVLRAPTGETDCADNACNPFFEMLPTHDGPFETTATWNGGRATLVLLQGSVLGRSQTATAIPYREAARADGTSPLRIQTSTSEPGEYALAFRHVGAGGHPLRSVRLEARWPTSS